MISVSTPLTLAVPKGRILKSLLSLLEGAGLDCHALRQDSRRLVIHDEAQGVRFILAKPLDVPTYVEYGAADLGFVGKDVLMERGQGISELLDLGIARCRLILAVPMASAVRSVQDLDANSRVATKYPRTATRFFQRHGLQVEVVHLNGSIELAPLVGLADAVVDITETGSTLRANGLTVIEEIASISTRLVANPVRHKVHYRRVEELVERLKEQVAARESPRVNESLNGRARGTPAEDEQGGDGGHAPL